MCQIMLMAIADAVCSLAPDTDVVIVDVRDALTMDIIQNPVKYIVVVKREKNDPVWFVRGVSLRKAWENGRFRVTSAQTMPRREIADVSPQKDMRNGMSNIKNVPIYLPWRLIDIIMDE